MLLSITTRHHPATDLGHLLHKHPDRFQTFSLATGNAHVFYPVATPEVCTATLLLDVDAVELVRRPGRPGRAEGVLAQYVNDRPYVASSFLSVAIAQVYGSALAGRSNDRPELAATPIPLEATLSVLPCRGGETFLRRLFEPLGYAVTVQPHLLDEAFPDWGRSRYFTTTLRATVRLSELLGHLYVLVPVLDDDKHYYVGEDEIEKLLHHGEAWLASHPERDRIVERYLIHRRKLARVALARLLDDEAHDPDDRAGARAAEEDSIEAPFTLADARIETVARILSESGARRVLDLGCGEGKLLKALLPIRSFDEIVGFDVSSRSLEVAAKRLAIDRLPERQARRIRLLHGSLLYRDSRLAGFDAAAVVEVIEHLDPPRLAAFERVVFECARPGTVVVTTPNVEFNVRFPTLPAGRLRHRDHRFEWTRAEFRAWAEGIAVRFRYTVSLGGVGADDPELGPPTQMAVFSRGTP